MWGGQSCWQSCPRWGPSGHFPARPAGWKALPEGDRGQDWLPQMAQLFHDIRRPASRAKATLSSHIERGRRGRPRTGGSAPQSAQEFVQLFVRHYAKIPYMDLSYPIGKFDWSAEVDGAMRPQWIAEIAGAAARFREAVRGLDRQQLDTPYRPGGWTVRQVVHHVPDSHMNCYVRFRLALTEEEPVIRPYDEKKWAELCDARTAPVEVSLRRPDGGHDGRRFRAHVSPSRSGPAAVGYGAGGICLALPPSRRPYYGPAPADGLDIGTPGHKGGWKNGEPNRLVVRRMSVAGLAYNDYRLPERVT